MTCWVCHLSCCFGTKMKVTIWGNHSSLFRTCCLEEAYNVFWRGASTEGPSFCSVSLVP